MRIAFFTVLSVACSTAAAHCLTETSARRVAENFRSTVADYSPELADRVFSVNFTDYADGVNELMNNGCPNGPKPLGSVCSFKRRVNSNLTILANFLLPAGIQRRTRHATAYSF